MSTRRVISVVENVEISLPIRRVATVTAHAEVSIPSRRVASFMLLVEAEIVEDIPVYEALLTGGVDANLSGGMQ